MKVSENLKSLNMFKISWYDSTRINFSELKKFGKFKFIQIFWKLLSASKFQVFECLKNFENVSMSKLFYNLQIWNF
jgi:hypothetical protein